MENQGSCSELGVFGKLIRHPSGDVKAQGKDLGLESVLEPSTQM